MDEPAQWKSISIRFKAPLVVALRAVAKSENRSFNGAVLEAVEQYLRRAGGASAAGVTSRPASAATDPQP